MMWRRQPFRTVIGVFCVLVSLVAQLQVVRSFGIVPPSDGIHHTTKCNQPAAVVVEVDPQISTATTGTETLSNNNKSNVNRRTFVWSAVLSASATATSTVIFAEAGGGADGDGSRGVAVLVQPANAAYGDSTNLELPNYIEFLIEKNAVVDPDTFLYKGPDPKVQLQRLLEASKRLQDIPALADDKKWSQVQGVLMGPLGTLAQTLNLIAKDATPDVQAKAKKIKEDIFSISTAASKKNQADVVANTSAATVDLEAFVRAAF